MWKIQYWNGTNWNDWAAVFERLTQELNGHEELVFVVPNTETNRALVASDLRVRLLWGTTEIWRGLLQAVTYKRDVLECFAYVEAYSKMAKRDISQSFTDAAVGDILQAICDAAGVTKGECPSGARSVEFKSAICLDAAKWLADSCLADFWADYDANGNPRFNIGKRGRNDLVLDLHLDEGSGTTAYDSSRYGNHGTISDASWIDGRYGKALSFDGVNDYVSIPHSGSLDLQNALTLAVWVYRTRAATEWIMNKNYDSATNTQYGILIRDSHSIELYLNGGARVTYTLNTVGRWAHIVCVWDGSTARIYVDGELKASASYSATLTSQPYALTLACRKTTGGVPGAYWFQGYLDEVRIYNRALSEEEIKALYEAGPPISWPERGIDRSKVVDRVIVVWTDSYGVMHRASFPSSGDRVAVVRDSNARDADTAALIAQRKFLEMSKMSSGVRLQFKVNIAYMWEPGDTITLSLPSLNLEGTFKIYRIEKRLDVVEVEVDKPQATVESTLEKLVSEQLGIYTSTELPPNLRVDSIGGRENKAVVLVHNGVETYFATVYDAAQKAVMGDEIIIRGHLTETQPIVFDKMIGLTIRGEGRATVTWQGSGFWITFTSDAWHNSFNNKIENLIIYCNGSNSGIKISDSFNTTLQDISIFTPNIGVEIASTNNFCEATNLTNVYVRAPTTAAVKFTRYGGTGSFALTRLDHVLIALTKPNSKGVVFDGNAVADRSILDTVQVWITSEGDDVANNAIGLVLDGGMDRASLRNICIEIPDGTSTSISGVIGLQFGQNFSGNICFLQEPVFYAGAGLSFYRKIDNPYDKPYTCFARDILATTPTRIRRTWGDHQSQDIAVFDADNIKFEKPLKLSYGSGYVDIIAGVSSGQSYIYMPGAGLGTVSYPLVYLNTQRIFMAAGDTFLQLQGGKDTYMYLYSPDGIGLGTLSYPFKWLDVEQLFLKAAANEWIQLICGKDTFKYIYCPDLIGLGTAAYPLQWVNSKNVFTDTVGALSTNVDLVLSPASGKRAKVQGALQVTGDVYIDSLPSM